MGRRMDSAEAVTAKLEQVVSHVAGAIAPVIMAADAAGVDPRHLDRDAFASRVTMRGIGAVVGISAMTVYPWLDRQGDTLRAALAAAGAPVHPALDGKALILEVARATVIAALERARPAPHAAPTAPGELPPHTPAPRKRGGTRRK